ncbi:MAG: hypothetical protein ABII13_03770 [Patescibacteria group bacterium]
MFSIEYLRQFRIGSYAIFDFAVTFLGIYLLSPLLSKLFRKLRIDVPKRNWLYLALPISIVAHLLVGEITPMTKNFLDIHGHYILKILIVSLLVLGIKGIKIIRKKS